MRAVDADFIIQEIDKLSLSPWARENTEKMEACSVIKDLCVRKAPTVFDAVEVAKQLEEAAEVVFLKPVCVGMSETVQQRALSAEIITVKKAREIIEVGGVK